MSNVVYLKTPEEDFYEAFICFNKDILMSCYVCGLELNVKKYDNETDYNSMLNIYKADWEISNESEYKQHLITCCDELKKFVESLIRQLLNH